MFELISPIFIKKSFAIKIFNIATIQKSIIIVINNVTKFNIFIVYLTIDLNLILNIDYKFREYIYAKKNLPFSKNIISKKNISILMLNLF